MAGADTFAARAQELRDFIGTRPTVAHNVAFDVAFLNAEFQRAGVALLQQNRRYCTMLRYQAMHGGRRKGSNLDAVAFRFGIPVRQGHTHTHRADEDVRITVEIARWFHQYDTQREMDQHPVNSFWLPPRPAPRSARRSAQPSFGDHLWSIAIILGLFLVAMVAC